MNWNLQSYVTHCRTSGVHFRLMQESHKSKSASCVHSTVCSSLNHTLFKRVLSLTKDYTKGETCEYICIINGMSEVTDRWVSCSCLQDVQTSLQLQLCASWLLLKQILKLRKLPPVPNTALSHQLNCWSAKSFCTAWKSSKQESVFNLSFLHL